MAVKTMQEPKSDEMAPILKPKFANLSVLEMGAYIIIWFAAIAYAIYQVFVAGEEYFNEYFLDIYNDLQAGWSWIGRRQDVADSEWIHGLKNLNILLPNFFVHFTVSEFLKKTGHAGMLPVWHIATGSFFTLSYLGSQTLLLFLIQPILYYFILQFNKKSVIWGSTMLLLISIHYLFDWTGPVHYTNEYLNYECKMQLTTVTLGWINLRCLNYFLDALDKPELKRINIRNLVRVIAYCLYLPLLYFGPLILYSDYSSIRWNENGIKRKPFAERIKVLIVNLIRFGFWLLVVEIALHFVYVAAIPFQLDFIREMPHFSLYGLGYLMGQFFHMKYVVFYGISTCLTHFELEVPVPRIPKCIGRIHLYSDMWKYFDRGLYMFLVKYIFKPTAPQAGRLIGSLFCFIFVYVWHGIQPYLLIWSILNYVGLALEALAYEISETQEFKKTILQDLDGRMYRRFQCLAASPLFAMSALSFFYFCGGKEVGDIFVQRLLLGPMHVKVVVLFVLYCGSHISMQIKHSEEKKQRQTAIEKTPSNKIDTSARPVSKNMVKNTIVTNTFTNKAIYYTDKLIKFKSTGQIDLKLKNKMLKEHLTRHHDPRKINLEQRDCSPPECNQYVETNVRDRASEPRQRSLSPRDEKSKLPKKIPNMKEEKRSSSVGSRSPKKDKKKGKDCDEKQIDELYKNECIKEKKRKLWHIMDKKI